MFGGKGGTSGVLFVKTLELKLQCSLVRKKDVLVQDEGEDGYSGSLPPWSFRSSLPTLTTADHLHSIL